MKKRKENIMKRKNSTPDKSAVYRNLGFSKITAPSSLSATEPKSTKINTKGDLRGGKS